MQTMTTCAVMLFALSTQTLQLQSQEAREISNVQLALYNESGGLASWHSGERGSDPDGTEVLVRRCNRPEFRVPTKPLFKMRGVTKLILHGVDFTDAELDGISAMKDLPALLINGRITDDGMKHLRDLTSLKKLWVYQTQVTGTGLRHLKNLDKLEYLYIDSKLSDDGFEQLKQLRHVQQFVLPDFPENRIEALRQALPDAEIFD